MEDCPRCSAERRREEIKCQLHDKKLAELRVMLRQVVSGDDNLVTMRKLVGLLSVLMGDPNGVLDAQAEALSHYQTKRIGGDDADS